MLTRAALFLAVVFIIAAAAMPSAHGARMILPGANRGGEGGREGRPRGRKAQQLAHGKARRSEAPPPLEQVLAELQAEKQAAAGGANGNGAAV
jgi:hypothetical protein